MGICFGSIVPMTLMFMWRFQWYCYTHVRMFVIAGDGHGGRPRRDSAPQGSARFKRQLSNVLQLQSEHINDQMAANSNVDPSYNYHNVHPRGSSRDTHGHTSQTPPLHRPITGYITAPSQTVTKETTVTIPGFGLERRGLPEDAPSLSASYVWCLVTIWTIIKRQFQWRPS